MVIKEKNQQQTINNIIKVNTINLAVCVLFYEKLEQTIECIKSFLSSGVNIYILNNGSSPSTRQALEQFCDNYKQIKIFDSDVNLGVGVGRNYLVAHTNEEWLLFVDNDITIKTADWVQNFFQYVYQFPNIEVLIPKLFKLPENEYAPPYSFIIIGNKAIINRKINNDLTNAFPGGSSFINRKLFNKTGLYDNKMFVGYEDFELCIRAIRDGNPVKARIIHDIKLVHNHSKIIKDEDKDAVLVRYNICNLRNSYNRIAKKHNLILDDNFKLYAANQIKKMLNNNFIFNYDWNDKLSDQNRGIMKRSIKIGMSFASLVLPTKVKRLLKKIFYLKQKTIPSNCSLFMTDRCNFKWIGCYRSVIGVKESKEMTLNTIKKLLSIYPLLNAFTVAGLGEPTLCSNFINIINFLKKNDKFVGITTNGTNLGKFLELAYEPNYISISLKGYDSKSYLANSGIEAFNLIIENYLKLKLKFDNVGFSYILNKSNYKDLDKLLPLCDKLKPSFLYLTNYLVYDPTVTNEIRKIITVKDSEIINYINHMCAGREYIRIKPIYIDFDKPSFNCRSYDYQINLDGECNIGGCQRQIPPNVSFGNVFIDDDPYNSLKMRSLRNLTHNKSYPHKECRFCFGNWE